MSAHQIFAATIRKPYHWSRDNGRSSVERICWHQSFPQEMFFTSRSKKFWPWSQTHTLLQNIKFRERSDYKVGLKHVEKCYWYLKPRFLERCEFKASFEQLPTGKNVRNHNYRQYFCQAFCWLNQLSILYLGGVRTSDFSGIKQTNQWIFTLVYDHGFQYWC